MRRSAPLVLAGLLSSCSAAAADGEAAACAPVSRWVAPASPRVPLEARAMLASAARKRVVLLGELHDREDHHRWQLHTVAALHALHPDLVLGFEMFPRRVQPALDRWVAGELSEREFLAAAEWRKVWNMDPRPYLPLFHFARMHRIPMLALDVERAERGRGSPPAPPPEAYVARLRHVWAAHPRPGGVSTAEEDEAGFRRFVDGQARHDRAMALSIAQALAARPGALVVGIMGQGHVAHGHGVPHQLKDLGVREVFAMLPWEAGADCEGLAPDLADALFGIAP